MSKHVCKNEYRGEGARGGCYLDIRHIKEGLINLEVGWSCIRVHDGEIPVTWVAELIAIATSHKGGISGFLEETRYGGDSYALMCDPVAPKEPNDG